MQRSFQHALVLASIAATGVAAAVSLSFAQDGSGGNSGSPPSTVSTPSGADTPSTNLLALTTVMGTNATLMNATTGAPVLNIPGLFGNASGLSNLPGSTIFTMTGGMASGGDVTHFLANGSLVSVGTTGFSSVPGCEWIGSTLYGSAAFAAIGDTLITIDPFTGLGTQVGAGYGGGIGGIDCLGYDPTTGTLWGSAGFFFAGVAGTEFTINPITGLATNTGVVMADAFGAPPSCTVASMTFDAGGQGYVGIGCGVGDVYEWKPGGSILFLGNNGQGGSSNGIQAIF